MVVVEKEVEVTIILKIAKRVILIGFVSILLLQIHFPYLLIELKQFLLLVLHYLLYHHHHHHYLLIVMIVLHLISSTSHSSLAYLDCKSSSIYPFIYLSIYLSIYPFIYLFIHLFTIHHLSIYQSIRL